MPYSEANSAAVSSLSPASICSASSAATRGSCEECSRTTARVRRSTTLTYDFGATSSNPNVTRKSAELSASFAQKAIREEVGLRVSTSTANNSKARWLASSITNESCHPAGAQHPLHGDSARSGRAELPIPCEPGGTLGSIVHADIFSSITRGTSVRLPRFDDALRTSACQGPDSQVRCSVASVPHRMKLLCVNPPLSFGTRAGWRPEAAGHGRCADARRRP